MALNGAIFGCILYGNVEMPIAHHTGLILSWNEYDPWESIIGHYGVNSEGKVFVETLRAAVTRGNIEIIKINPHFKARFEEIPYHIDSIGNILPGKELAEYGAKYPTYDIWKCNCQHFVRHFVGPIHLESDIHQYIPYICSSLVNTGMFGSSEDIMNLLHNMTDKYHEYRNSGICHWDTSLDMYSPWFKKDKQV